MSEMYLPEKQNEEIELMDIFSVIFKRKMIIIGVVSIAMVCAVFFIFFQEKIVKTELVITLNFIGVEKGAYPDGSDFRVSDIVTPYILTTAGVDSKLFDYVFAEAIVPDYIRDKIKADPDYKYHPNRFKVSLVEYEKPILESDIVRELVVQKIVQAFKQDLKRRFSISEPFLWSLPEKFVREGEFDSILFSLGEKITTAMNYMNSRASSEMAFQSKKTYADIIGELSVLQSSSLRNVIAQVNGLNLARSRDTFLLRLQGDIEEAEGNSEVYSRMTSASLELIKMVTQDAGKGSENKMIVERDDLENQMVSKELVVNYLKESDYLFYLIQVHLDNSMLAVQRQQKTEKLRHRLKGMTDIDSSLSGSNVEIEKQLFDINTTLMKLSDMMYKMNNYHLESLYSDSLRIDTIPIKKVQYLIKPMMVFLIAFIASVFFGLALAFFMEYKARQSRTFDA